MACIGLERIHQLGPHTLGSQLGEDVGHHIVVAGDVVEL
jgi:hypothetical protein